MKLRFKDDKEVGERERPKRTGVSGITMSHHRSVALKKCVEFAISCTL